MLLLACFVAVLRRHFCLHAVWDLRLQASLRLHLPGGDLLLHVAFSLCLSALTLAGAAVLTQPAATSPDKNPI